MWDNQEYKAGVHRHIISRNIDVSSLGSVDIN